MKRPPIHRQQSQAALWPVVSLSLRAFRDQQSAGESVGCLARRERDREASSALALELTLCGTSWSHTKAVLKRQL